MTRRQMLIALAGAAGTAVVAGMAGEAGKTEAIDAQNGDAYGPWRNWSNGSGLMLAARAAILAASPHNTQPWQFHIGADQIDVFADLRRTIGTIDPLFREQQISTGCALENLIVAAKQAGFGVREMLLDPDPASGRIASVTFTARPPVESTACCAIPYRHTNRGPYLVNRTISAELLKEAEQLNTDQDSIQLILWTDQRRHEQIRELVIAATEAIVADREQSHDSALWYRGTTSAINRYRDGITLEAQGLSPFMNAVAKFLPEPSQQFADRLFINRTKNIHCGPGSILGTIVASVPAEKSSRVRVGRLWQRIHLWGTAHGLAMQPLNQIHERIDREATTAIAPTFTHDLAALIGQPNWHGLFSFRMGYPARAATPSPRRELAQFLV